MAPNHQEWREETVRVAGTDLTFIQGGTGKPLLVDFTGWACMNCRRMEENVWSDPRVLKILAEDYVLVSLYVDDKTKLPAEEQVVAPIGTKERKLKTNIIQQKPWI